VNGDALTGGLVTTATTASDVGAYGIAQGSLAASANYNVTFDAATLGVTARPITVTADSLGREYGNANPALTYAIGGDGLVNGDALTGALETPATITSNVGSYGIGQGTLAGSGNYDITTFTGGTLAVTARPITVTANDLNREYGDANPALIYAIGGDGLVNGDTLTGGLATPATLTSGAGTYGITQGTLAASSNYDMAFFAGTLTVEPTDTNSTPGVTGQEDILGTNGGSGLDGGPQTGDGGTASGSDSGPGTGNVGCVVNGGPSGCDTTN
jgi:hypothetical protein